MDLMLGIVGQAPLVMHNARLVDPLDEWTQKLAALTGKKSKTLDDHARIARTEFEGGLHYDEEIGPYFPGEGIYKCLVKAGALRRKGAAVERALIVMKEAIPIQYEGPRDPEGLYTEGFLYRKSVGVRGNRVMRTRPRWDEWALSVPCVLDTSQLNESEFGLIAADAGQYIGLGERRPQFGRFLAAVTTR